MKPELEFSEIERYELHEGVRYHFEFTRREFVQILGAGLIISVAITPALGQRSREQRDVTLDKRLHIGADGDITVLTSKVEVGQGSRTQLTQAAAEELHVPPERVRFIMADSALVPDDGGTAGSRTTPSSVPAIRKACAAARQLLIETAAATHNADASDLSVRDGKVEGLGSERSFAYADLANEKHAPALSRGVPADVALANVKNWRILGTSVPRVAARDVVTGAHKYPSDIVRPGMLYGAVLRPPSYGASLTEIDLKSAGEVLALRDGDFVGFAASTSFAANEARDAVSKTAKWKTAEHPSSDELFDYLRLRASLQRPRRDVKGAPDELLKDAPKSLRQSYNIAYIQHAPMETRAAVAEWKGDDLTVWTGTQQPSRVRDDLARTLRVPRERIRVIVPDTGGGFGGKHSGEAAVEAARLALEAKRPVCVRWSREEEFTWAYFRPAGIIDISAALDGDAIKAWQHVNYLSGGSGIACPYDIPNTATEFRSTDSPLRGGSYRALASTANNFARESFMNELAAVSNADPLQFRLRHLKHDRLQAVLVAATDKFGWSKHWKPNSKPQSTGLGLACGTEKGSYVATCVRIEVDEKTGRFKVLDVCEAFECGAIQNPANLRAQVEGCVIQGLGGALHEQMRFKDGKILNAKFSQYHVPRFREVPKIETVLVNRTDLASAGAGETPIIGIAPAIANALAHAVQIRVRSMPLLNEQYRGA